jgi:hypothetical protein
VTLLAVSCSSLAAQASSASDDTNSLFATQPGIGLGVSAGGAGFNRGTNTEIQNGFMVDGFIRYGTSFGLFLHGGINLGSHEVAASGDGYRTASFYLEPRYVALFLSSRIAPFLGGRIGYTRESLNEPGVKLWASGLTLGGSLGAVLQLTGQVALEGGVNLGTTQFGDYTFQGQHAWYECLSQLEPGTSLTQTAVQCAPASDSPVQWNCYPPYYDRYGGNCVPPEIPYEDTRRDVTRLGLWIGLHMSLLTFR